jgi:hypothetical protein
LKKVDVKLEETTKERKVDSCLNQRMSHWRKKYLKIKKKGKMERRSKEKKSANVKKARKPESDSLYVNVWRLNFLTN